MGTERKTFLVPKDLLPQINIGGEVEALHAAAKVFEEAKKKMGEALRGPFHQTIADGIARQHGARGSARFTFSDKGDVVVEILTRSPAKPEAKVETRGRVHAHIPSSEMIWREADKYHVDVSDVCPRGKKPTNEGKKLAMARIDAAKTQARKAKAAAKPETKVETKGHTRTRRVVVPTAKPAPQPSAH